MNQMLTDRPVKPTERHRPLPPSLDAVVLRALAKEPAERWPSVAGVCGGVRTGGGRHPAARPWRPKRGLLARYELGAPLGRGRLGSLVYNGTHRALGIPVAIRVLKNEDLPHWDAVRARFLLEARTLQIVASEPAARPRFRRGRSQRVRRHRPHRWAQPAPGAGRAIAVSVDAASQHLMAQALDAVAALNRRGGYIAGVNPDMIRLTSEDGHERIVLSTAGIASVQDVLATMREQELRGQEASEQELPYVAPEVLMGRAPDPRADVFTMGVLAYQMTTGRLPYRAASMPELIGQMLQTTPVAPAALNADVPRARATRS